MREAARARRQRKAPAPPKVTRPPGRRGFLARLTRRLVLVAILLAVAVALASAAYSTIRMQLDHVGWLQALDDFRKQVTRVLGG